MKKIYTIIISCSLLILTNSAIYATSSFTYDSGSRRDPMVPLVDKNGVYIITSPQQQTSINDVYLQGITYDVSGGSIAVINGELVKEGEQIGTLNVKKIGPDFVVIIIEDKEYVLNIFKEAGDGK